MLRVGVDLGGHTILAASMDFDGCLPHVISQLEESTPVGRGLDDVSNLIADMVVRMADGGEVASVGVGVPGFVGKDRRRVARLTNFNSAENVDFAAMVEKSLKAAGIKAKVFIENDANCAALGEGLCGAACGCRDYIVITLGTGIGSGIVANGALVTGAHGMAAEAGHMVLTCDTTRCGCGGTGHFETASSADWIERMALARGLPGDFKVLWQRRREECVAEILEPALDVLARGVASLAAVMDPEVIVLSGGMSRACGLAEEVTARAEPYLPAPLRGLLRIETTRIGGQAAVIGAAGLWREEARCIL